MEEIWKDIKGYEGLYQVSNLGRVKRVGRKILKQQKSKGYLRVWLSKNDKPKWYLVHRLVAEAFIANPNNYPVVNHLDCNPSNNIKENLEWVTHYENVHHKPTSNKRSESMTNGKKSKRINQYSLDGEFIREWPSTMEIERQLKLSHSNISACCLGKYKQVSGSVWKYADNKKEIA